MGRIRPIQLTKALALLLILAYIPANAQAQKEERLLPQWRECLIEGERHACFNLEDTRALLVLETKAISWKKRISLYKEQQLRFEQVVAYKDKEIKELEKKIKLYKGHTEELSEQLLDEVEKKNEYRAKADSSPIWPWLVAGLLATLSAGFGVGIYVARR